MPFDVFALSDNWAKFGSCNQIVVKSLKSKWRFACLTWPRLNDILDMYEDDRR